MRKKSFHKKDLLKRRKCKLTSSFFELLSFWCSLSRQEAWKGCIQYKCFICKTICREERRKSSCKPQKNLKENASEKSRFLQKCTFYCFSSLSLFAGINQSIIKPFPTTIESSTIKQERVISTQHNCKIMTSSEEEERTSKKRRCPGQVDDGWKLLLLWLRHAGMKGIISWKVIPHRGISN